MSQTWLRVGGGPGRLRAHRASAASAALAGLEFDEALDTLHAGDGRGHPCRRRRLRAHRVPADAAPRLHHPPVRHAHAGADAGGHGPQHRARHGRGQRAQDPHLPRLRSAPSSWPRWPARWPVPPPASSPTSSGPTSRRHRSGAPSRCPSRWSRWWSACWPARSRAGAGCGRVAAPRAGGWRSVALSSALWWTDGVARHAGGWSAAGAGATAPSSERRRPSLVLGWAACCWSVRHGGRACLVLLGLGATWPRPTSSPRASSPVSSPPSSRHPSPAGLFGGVTGSGADFVIAAFRQAGADLEQAVLGQSLISDPVDKVITYFVGVPHPWGHGHTHQGPFPAGRVPAPAAPWRGWRRARHLAREPAPGATSTR